MHRSRTARARGLALALAGLALAGLAGTASASSGDVAFQRISGPDRISTAAAAAATAFPHGAGTAIIARADDFPDAMTAAALAGAHDAPVLLSARDHLAAPLAAALDDLGVSRIVLVGGEAAVSSRVARALRSYGSVRRVAGVDRYATAATIADEVAAEAGVPTLDGRRTAFLANAFVFADALAAGPISFAAGHPILLTLPDRLPTVTADALRRLDVEKVVLLGGGTAVSGAVVDEVRALGISVSRIGGATRTDTAARLADAAIERFGASGADALVVRGDDFADALVAGPVAGRMGGVVLLTASPAEASLETQRWLADRCAGVRRLRVVGGGGAVSPGAASAALLSAERCEVAGPFGVTGAAVGALTTGPTAYVDPGLGRRLTYADLRPSGTVRSTRDGQVIERLDILGQLVIAHDDVTVRAVRIRNPGGAYSVSYEPGSGARGATLSYVEVDGRRAPGHIGVYLNFFTMRHSHVHGHSTGVRFGSGSTIEQSYVHAQVVTPGSHNTAMSIHGGTGSVVRGNNLVGSTSSALSLYPNLAPLKDILVERNLFNGGSYCTYGGSGPRKPYRSQTEGIRYLDNGFGRAKYPRCGQYGPVTVFDPTRPGNAWSGNLWVDTGARVDP